MNNLSSYCGLVDAKIRASDKDLPLQEQVRLFFNKFGDCRTTTEQNCVLYKAGI